MDVQKFKENEAFIDRMIDAIRDHYDPLYPTVDEVGHTHSLWRTDTPREYSDTKIRSRIKDVEIRIRIHQALQQHQMDNALFLILTLCREPIHLLPDDERRPWCF